MRIAEEQKQPAEKCREILSELITQKDTARSLILLKKETGGNLYVLYGGE